MSEEREAAFLQWLTDGNSTGGCNPSMRKAWYAALKWQAGRRTAHLSNLLARIHRDGGHYEAEHGTEKAVAEAEKRIAELNGGAKTCFACEAGLCSAHRPSKPAESKRVELEECAKKLLDFVDGLLLPVQDYAEIQDTCEQLRALLARAQAKGE